MDPNKADGEDLRSDKKFSTFWSLEPYYPY